MKRAFLIVTILMLICNLAARIKTATVYADFDKKNKHRLYHIYCDTNYHTVFKLPKGKKIRGFIIADIESWEAFRKGNLIFVKPFNESVKTSLTIVNWDYKMYKFILIEGSDFKNGYEFVSDVIIKDGDLSGVYGFGEVVKDEEKFFENSRKNYIDPYTEEKAVKAKIKMLKKLNYKYEIRDKHFDIKEVYDDRIFTYIYLPKNQERPAIYVAKKKQKKRHEPVRYVDDGEMLIVHRVLKRGEIFVLKNGKNKSKIYKRFGKEG